MLMTSALSRLSAWKSAPISGLMRFATIELTTAVNAAPMTTATARSITFPRRMNSLNPLSTDPPRRSLCSGTSGHASGGPRSGRTGAARRGAADEEPEEPPDEPPEEPDEPPEEPDEPERAARRRPARRRAAARGIRPRLRAVGARVGAVEARAVEGHADRAEHLAQRAAAHRAHGERVVGERLDGCRSGVRTRCSGRNRWAWGSLGSSAPDGRENAMMRVGRHDAVDGLVVHVAAAPASTNSVSKTTAYTGGQSLHRSEGLVEVAPAPAQAHAACGRRRRRASTIRSTSLMAIGPSSSPTGSGRP